MALAAALEPETLVRPVRTTLSVGKLPLLSTLRVLEVVEGKDREPGVVGADLTVDPRNAEDVLAVVESFETGLLVRRLFVAALDGLPVNFPALSTTELAVSSSAV